MAKKGLCLCNYIKDLEMGRYSWIIQMGPECHHKHPHKKEAEGDLTTEGEVAMWPGRQRLSDVAISQGTRADTRNWMRNKGFSLGVSRRSHPCCCLDFSALRLAVDFWSLKLQESPGWCVSVD